MTQTYITILKRSSGLIELFWGDALKIRSKKLGRTRIFYDEGGNKIAWYEININEPSIIIHSKYLSININLPKKYLEKSLFAEDLLAKLMPRRLAKSIVRHGIKDLKIKPKIARMPTFKS